MKEILKYQKVIVGKILRKKRVEIFQEMEKLPKIGKRVLVWGTFDCLHFGHKIFMKAAKRLGEKLYVVVVPDKCVLENKKRLPFQPDFVRRKYILSLPFVEEVFIDSISQGMSCLKKIKPDVICLGNDQSLYWAKQLQICCLRNNISPRLVRLPSSFDLIHTTQIVTEIAKKRGISVQSLAEESWRHYCTRKEKNIIKNFKTFPF